MDVEICRGKYLRKLLTMRTASFFCKPAISLELGMMNDVENVSRRWHVLEQKVLQHTSPPPYAISVFKCVCEYMATCLVLERQLWLNISTNFPFLLKILEE